MTKSEIRNPKSESRPPCGPPEGDGSPRRGGGGATRFGFRISDFGFGNQRGGFTLIELLVVICIIGILVALTTVGIVKALESSRGNATQSMLDTISGALAQYAQRWGDYPPSTVDDLGLRAPNDTNNGIEALVACLSSQKRGGVLYHADDQLSNVDGDSLAGLSKSMNSIFGDKDDQLHEWVDNFGFTLIYMHGKDFAKPRAGIKKYKFMEGGEDLTIGPEQNPATKNFYGAGRFQLRSVGKDGKPGTADDIRGGN
ncbi:MAG: prepilin-type N-terminal cleavage/methylation domain-containing protein [Planctomycetes bacterium]|nr:prepilin-type N-terminal cleavage/methylation domain-containing protein [Planctomycetota bacterium]